MIFLFFLIFDIYFFEENWKGLYPYNIFIEKKSRYKTKEN